MANKVVTVPGVGNVAFPDTMSDDDISQALSRQFGAPTQQANQALAASGVTAPVASPGENPIQMQQSWAPKVVRGVGTALPAVGGIVGGIGGAALGGAGSIPGAGLGTMAGEAGREAINEAMGDQPLSQEDVAKNIALAGTTGMASQALGGALTGTGSRLINLMGRVPIGRETGDVAAALRQVAPVAASKEGITSALQDAFDSLSNKLTRVFSNPTKTTPFDAVVQPSQNVAAQSSVKGLSTRLNNIITAAKENAGITGNDVTPDQLFNFAKEIRKPNIYAGNPGPVTARANKILMNLYGDVSNAVKTMEPAAGDILDQLTNLHAAQSALNKTAIGTTRAAALTAATHPITTAALSPAATVAGAYGGSRARDIAGMILRNLVP